MRWDPRIQMELRRAVEAGAPGFRVGQISESIGKSAVTACERDWGNLRDAIDELETTIDIMDARSMYQDCGVPCRAALTLMCTWDDRITEAEKGIDEPLRLLVASLEQAPASEKHQFYPDVALLFAAKARLEQHMGRHWKRLAFIKASWNVAQLTVGHPGLKILVLNQYQSVLFHQGETEVAAAVANLLRHIKSVPFESEWSTSPCLWQLEVPND